MTEPTCVHCGLTFLQHDNHDCQGDWSAMTEPKHIPLTARLRQYAEGKAEEFRHLLQTPDEALIEFEDDPTEEEYR